MRRPTKPAFPQAKPLIFLSTRFSVDEYRAVFPVNVTSPVEALTHVFAKELGPRRITVNAVAPGPVETDLFLTGKSDEQVKAIVGMNPMRRLGQPEDIASVVAFLVSSESGWINGQTIRANGGVI